MVIIGFALALVVGLAMGLLGAGGSILTVPIFVYVLGLSAKESIAMGLAVVGATSVVGAVRHARAGHVNLRLAALFGPVAMAGAYLGARLSVFFSGAAQLALFGAVMLAAGIVMLRDSTPATGAASRHGPSAFLFIMVEGLAVGVLTGLVGVGGGFLIVPVFVLLRGLSMQQAVGTSLAVIALKSAAGFAGYLGQVEVLWGLMGVFTLIAIVGIWLGSHLVRFVSHEALKRAFAIFIFVMGAWMLFQNLGGFRVGS
ncbi:MAG: sulfite exporter TauE/SafE family protein [Gemmatimonadetes bacterium]|nr:sulfite exporter TauE/SafE family protein [Gemmatimonadota bacterium]